MQNERIKTEEHIEYDSDDSSSDGSSSTSSRASRHKLEPEVYKTRKDENFTEYFKIHKNQVETRDIVIVATALTSLLLFPPAAECEGRGGPPLRLRV